ncbi:MAG: hypothetical protein IKM61_05395 [Eubacteriaceae bacterium]|nr:hypothetical protein [Eubacteriaceae bacterium]
MKRKILSLASLLLAVLMLASCGGEKYPALNVTDLSAEELETAENSTIAISFPKDEWTADTSISPLTVYYDATYGTDNATNINAQAAGKFPNALNESHIKELFAAVEENPALTIDLCEMRTLGEENVIYGECTTRLTDDAIDMLIENGTLTQELIDFAGGREFFLNIPPVSQIMIYAVVDDTLCLYVGSYYNENEKQLVLDVINVMYENTVVK